MTGFNHFNPDGDPHMVDISEKDTTSRTAIAEGRITMLAETLSLIRDRGHKKGDVIQVAQLAGIMGAKKTADLIPLCHPIGLTHVSVDISIEDDGLLIRAECRVTGQTGVEMEALTAASVAALTVYDMCKAVDRGMVISRLRLIRKSGGKSGVFEADDQR